MFALLAAVAFLSGAAALVYELIWFQSLELSLGATAISLATVLATFMGGTCVGSLLAPRLARKNPLKIYALIELGIGTLAVLLLYANPPLARLYTSWSGPGIAGLCARGAAAAIFLLAPTILMGMTFPILSSAVPGDAPRIGIVYGANILGGVCGCLLAAFYLLRFFDVATATFAAAGMNLAAAAVAAVAWPGSAKVPGADRAASEKAQETRFPAVHLALAISGFCALASEAIWTRALSLLVGASVYGFAIILAVFLLGLGAGNWIGSAVARRTAHPRTMLGWCQAAVAAAIAWTAFHLFVSFPLWPLNPESASGVWINFQVDWMRASWALLPPALLWGMSFPLALASTGIEERDSTRVVSGLYASNTVGAVLGAVLASLWMVPSLGSQHAQQLVAGVSVLGALLLLIPPPRIPSLSRAAGAALAGALAVYSIPPVSSLLIAYGRFSSSWYGKSDIVYAKEGMNSAVAVARFANGATTFHVAGKIQASSVPRDMRLQRMLGHLTTLPTPSPRSVLVIGCGAGVTAGAVSIDPKVERETIVEIERSVPQAAATYFAAQNFDVLHNPKVRLQMDDGRHFLLTTHEQFDGITIDPLDPWVRGAANLYTREFYEVMKDHLRPGGVITMYIQLFETTPEAVKSSLATFFEVFPNGTVWGNPYEGRGHDMVLMGQQDGGQIDLDQLEERLRTPGYGRLNDSLNEVGFESAVDLFATYAGRASGLKPWLAGAAINRDTNLRMQYLAGLGLNLDQSAEIYAQVLSYRRFPSDIFVSKEGRDHSIELKLLRP